MNVCTRLTLLACSLLLAACGSAPITYYTLIPPQANQPDSATGADFQLQVMPVRIPLQIDQPGMVIRQSDGRLAILETSRWAAPPADEFHDALAMALEARLGVRDLAGLPANPGMSLVIVRTDVRRFDSLLDNHAALDVVWSVQRGKDGASRSLTCSSTIRKPAGPGIEGLVLAHQQAIAGLADAISDTVQRWGRCP